MISGSSLVKTASGFIEAENIPFSFRTDVEIDSTSLTMSNGINFECSNGHLILVMNTSGEYEWKNASDITEGEFVAIDRSDAILPEALEIFDETYFKFPTHATEEFGYFLGLIVGDGCMTVRGRISLTSIDKFIVDEFTRLSFVLFGLTPYRNDEITISINSVKLWDELSKYEICTKSENKKFPRKILQSPKSTLIGFIRGLMDTDGYSEFRSGNIGIGLASEDIIRNLQHVLISFGVMTRLSINKTTHLDSFRLNASGRSARAYFDKIGFGLDRKQINETRLPATNNENLDLVPNIGHKITMAKKFGVLPRKLHKILYDYEISRRLPSYEKLKEIISILPDSEYKRDLISISSDQFFWAKVISKGTSKNYMYEIEERQDRLIANSIVTRQIA